MDDGLFEGAIRNLGHLPIVERDPSKSATTPVPAPAMSRLPSPDTGHTDLDQLKQLIKKPSSAFTTGNPLEKQIWAHNLTEAELKQALGVAHAKLETAMRDHIRALMHEVEKLEAKLDHGLVIQRHHDFRDLKGDMCVKVMERWCLEKLTEDMTGKKAG